MLIVYINILRQQSQDSQRITDKENMHYAKLHSYYMYIFPTSLQKLYLLPNKIHVQQCCSNQAGP